MNVDKYRVSKFLSQANTNFVIPVFQRNYSWREENWQRLYDDLVSIVAGAGGTYFLGTVCIKQHGYHSDGVGEISIIDGQQRVTTLSLFLIAMRDVVGRNEPDLAQEIDKTYLYNKNYGVDMKHRVRLCLSDSDDASYKHVLANGDDVYKSRFGNITLVEEAYCYFRRLLSDVELSVMNDLRLSLNTVETVVLDVGDEDPQVVFESLNSTGVSLEPVDLLRNYLLMGLPGEEQRTIYFDYWRKIEKAVGFSNMPQFFADALIYLRSSHKIAKAGISVVTITAKKIYEAYRIYYDFRAEELGVRGGSALVTKALLGDLLPLADLYGALCFDGTENRQDMDDLERAFYDLLVINACSASRPILLLVLNRLSQGLVDESTAVSMVRAVLTYVIRHKVCGVRGGGMTSQFVTTMFKSLASEPKNARNTIGAFWRALDSGRGSFALRSDKDFWNALLRKPVFDSLKARGVFVWFMSELDYSLGDKTRVLDLDDLRVVHAIDNHISDGTRKALGFDKRVDFETCYNSLPGCVLVERDIDVSGDTVLSNSASGLSLSNVQINKLLLAEGSCSKTSLSHYGRPLVDAAVSDVFAIPRGFPTEGTSRNKVGRRPPFMFSMANISSGEYITFRSNSAIRAKVVDERHVLYKNREWTLSSLAGYLIGSGPRRGPDFFTYDGQVLSDLREQNGY